ncbi:MAG TPA: glycosyltransferase [Solirubrobacteraceae bacterium]|nr:glycosyltransferase [Solirubrobacteraceae bacterium]
MTDVLLVCIGSTAGLRAADDELAASLRRAGATVSVATAAPQADVPTFALTDFLWARAARAAAIRAFDGGPVGAVIYSTITAALFWPRPGAIRFDAPALANRPGRHGFWQRPLERVRLRQAPLLIPQSTGALAEARAGETPSIVVPVAVRASGPATGVRDIAAITYGANPAKKGLDRVLAAWAQARRPGEELVVAGVSALPPDAQGRTIADGVRVVGMIAPDAYRALLRRSRVYVTAPRREDYGVAQLEALADGCMLVTNRAPGPYVALELAEDLDGRLVGDDLAAAIRAGLDDPRPGYAAAAAAGLEPISDAAVDRLVATQLLGALGIGGRVAAC